MLIAAKEARRTKRIDLDLVARIGWAEYAKQRRRKWRVAKRKARKLPT